MAVGVEFRSNEIKVMDSNGKEVVRQKIDKQGPSSVEMPEYFVDGDVKTVSSPYTVVVGKLKWESS